MFRSWTSLLYYIKRVKEFLSSVKIKKSVAVRGGNENLESAGEVILWSKFFGDRTCPKPFGSIQISFSDSKEGGGSYLCDITKKRPTFSGTP